MKKKLIIILCTVLVLLPTIVLFGVYLLFSNRRVDIVSSDIVLAKVSVSNGKTAVYKEEDEELKLFLDLHGDGVNYPKELSTLPLEAQKYAKYQVVYTDSYDVDESFTYYFSTNKNKCYYINSSNQPYQIPAACAERFLNSDNAENVYDSATPPVVRLSGVTLKPNSLDWHYKTIGGTLKEASCSFSDRAETEEVGSFDVGMGVEVSYEPERVELRIEDAQSGKSLFEGDREGLKSKIFEGSTNVKVSMTIFWNEDEKKDYAGRAEYFFTGRLLGTPAFTLNASSARCGDVLILSAYNIIDPSCIRFESNPAFDYEPVFYKVKDVYQALIPLRADLVSENTTYRFTVSSTSATDVLTLEVSPLNKGTFLYYSPTAKEFYNEATLSNLEKNITPILTAHSSFSFDGLSGGKFVVPTENYYISTTASYPFATIVAVDGLNKTFISRDIMYCANARWVKDENGENVYLEGNSTSVLAAYSGKVVYVGAQTYTGRLVIIDHGSGLMTWYTNLSSDIAVHVGDMVTTGQFISHAADGGFNDRMNFNFHVGAFVYGIPVSLQQLIDRGLIAG